MEDRAIVDEVLGVLGTGRQIVELTARDPKFELADAYRVARQICDRRIALGDRPVGRKIGFTNRSAWASLRVAAPIWSAIYASTVHDLGPNSRVSLGGLAEPRIEPEIVFGLASAPSPGMDEHQLGGCVDWVAHGFRDCPIDLSRMELSPARCGCRLRHAQLALDRAASFIRAARERVGTRVDDLGSQASAQRSRLRAWPRGRRARGASHRATCSSRAVGGRRTQSTARGGRNRHYRQPDPSAPDRCGGSLDDPDERDYARRRAARDHRWMSSAANPALFRAGLRLSRGCPSTSNVHFYRPRQLRGDSAAKPTRHKVRA